MTGSAAGPFTLGDRVYVRAFDSEGEVVEVGETQAVRVFDVSDPEGELRHVTTYEVRLDNGFTRAVADRDGHLVRAAGDDLE
jgi:hypothetical protein